MGKLFNTIRELVADEKYVVGVHASENLEERGIMEWQAVAVLDDGELIAEKPKSKPNPMSRFAKAFQAARNSKRYGHC